MYVCMYIHMYVYMYIQMCANAAAYQAGRDTSVSKYTDIDTDTYVCAYRQTHTLQALSVMIAFIGRHQKQTHKADI